MTKKNKFVTFGIIIGLILVITTVGIVYFNNKNNSDFYIEDTLEDGENEKVKVFLLAGQSNASGCSYVEELKNNIDDEKFNEYSNGYDNIYINFYNDGGNNKSNGFVNVKLGQGANNFLFGPEVGMAEELHEAYPDETIFIIKYAWGGTSLHTLWKPDKGDLYIEFINFVRSSMQYLEDKNYDAEIISMMWMQGEADADELNSLKYEENLKNLINNVRSTFDSYIEEEMYFVDAYISDSIYWKYYSNINAAKQNVCNTSQYNICIDTISDGLSYSKEPIGNPDLAHYDSLSEIKLGHLFIHVLLGDNIL